ncbi:ArsR/SmtB family transcription factor [Clostridium folliculivorans]|uniref:Transcriptional regulator n=1 Tax=Clostridium folliculivorans TaxID=2886038 RepID=A0A9W6DCK0_9CLOT|nr:metalloregulator ArsR/SmtB family transcription factor [Clostridium folliculivorans]GKU27077.1 transcriptional regulator [Clostridium folliculivorans]GKU31694.1 transcriptional regulator [Clostridium folliculivorans]
MEMNYKELEEIAELLKIIAHPVRLCIIKGLIESGGCNVSHMQECLELPQSTVSQHLQKLRSFGIIEGDKNGLEITYRVSNDKVSKLVKAITEIDRLSK